MPEQSIKDKTAIVGIGWTAFSAILGQMQSARAFGAALP